MYTGSSNQHLLEALEKQKQREKVEKEEKEEKENKVSTTVVLLPDSVGMSFDVREQAHASGSQGALR